MSKTIIEYADRLWIRTRINSKSKYDIRPAHLNYEGHNYTLVEEYFADFMNVDHAIYYDGYLYLVLKDSFLDGKAINFLSTLDVEEIYMQPSSAECLDFPLEYDLVVKLRINPDDRD